MQQFSHHVSIALFAGAKKLFWLYTILALALDLWTKHMLFMPDDGTHEKIDIIPGLLRIAPHGGNVQGAFGLGPANPMFFAVVALLGLAVILILLWRMPPHRWHVHTALGLLAGGAMGNLYDRLALGFVRDFVDLYWRRWHWPTFNGADIAIFLGVASILLAAWKNRRSDKTETPHG